jgi:F-type H+-transporting ATPase subunit b
MELLQDAEFWVGVAFVIFVGILVWAKVPAALLGALDSRARRIQAQLDEATRLREEAQALLAEIKVKREEAETTAVAIMEMAKAEAVRLQEEAKVQLAEQIKRRGEMAERRIALAEVQAAAEVKAAAVDLATQIAETVLAARLAGASADPLVDAAVAQVASKLQ